MIFFFLISSQFDIEFYSSKWPECFGNIFLQTLHASILFCKLYFLPCDIPPATHCSFPINPVMYCEVKNLACGIYEAFRLALSKENHLRKNFTETGYCI